MQPDPNPGLFFASWSSMGRIAVLAILVYLCTVGALRLFGQRALAQMSAYDLLVTIALGSILASIPLQQSITLADGLTAIISLLVLQHAMSWILKRWRKAQTVIKSRPAIVVYEGRMLQDRMLGANVTDAEVRAAARASGRASIADCLAIVLENDGSWSVIPRGEHADRSALEDLELPGS